MNEQMSLLGEFDIPERPNTDKKQEFTFSRYTAQGQGYELSSKGDGRFSALYAKLADGRTIEEAYQLDVKGYRVQSNYWGTGKGRPAINGKTHDQLWEDYLQLWKTWAEENPQAIEDLRVKAKGKVLTDRFASSPISQARALSIILNETADQAMPTIKKMRP